MEIYVGNLAYASTDDGLKAAFAQYGEVTAVRVVRSTKNRIARKLFPQEFGDFAELSLRQDQASCPVFHGILSPSDLSKSDFPVPTRRADQESSSGIGRVRSGYIRLSAEPADTSCG